MLPSLPLNSPINPMQIAKLSLSLLLLSALTNCTAVDTAEPSGPRLPVYTVEVLKATGVNSISSVNVT